MDGLGFPIFNDGDVKVWIDQNFYQLHSEALKRRSRLFRHALQDAPQFGGFAHFYLAPSELSEVGIVTVQVRAYRAAECELKFLFINRSANKRWNSSPPIIECLFDESAKVREYWDHAFRTPYKIKPNLRLLNRDHGTVAFELVDLCEIIGSKTIVDQGVDLALRDLGQRLFLMVSSDPVGWLSFASRIRSGVIYHEALIHLIGKWHQLTKKDQSRVALLPDYTTNIVGASLKEFKGAKKNVEAQLLSYTPPGWMSLCAETPYRTDNSMLKAVGIFRQWFAHQIADGNNIDNCGAGTKLCRTIAAGGDAYLGEEKFNYLHGLPSHWGLAEESKIEDKLKLIKDDVALIVAPLLVNESRYDPQQLGELPYLTCIKVEIDTIPWNEWVVEDGNNGWSDIESSDSESGSTDSWTSLVNYSDKATFDEPAETMALSRQDFSNFGEPDEAQVR